MNRKLRDTTFHSAIHEVELYGLILMDLEGRILTWNRGALDLLGFNEAEVLNQKFDFIFNEEDRQRNIPQLEMSKALQDGHAYDDRWHVKKDKTQIYVNGGLCLLKSDEGEPIGFVKIIRDQTERKAHLEKIEYLNAQLLKARQELQEYAATLEIKVSERTKALNERNQEMQDFCYSIAHDLRAPLRSIQAMSEVVLEDFGTVLGDQGKDYLARIARAGERLDRLTLDLLAYTRFSREEIKLVPVELGSVVEEILLAQAGNVISRQATVKVNSSLPSVMGQPVYVSQILGNFISNALKFTVEGRPPVIEIYTETKENRVWIYVKDNGKGIDPAYHERIFLLFERLDTESSHEGTGAGLAIARKAAQRMSGRVGVEAPGDGSLFWLELEKAQE